MNHKTDKGNKLIINTILMILFAFIIYGLGAFYSTSFNITNWSSDTRFVITSLMFAGLVLSYLHSGDKK